MRQVLALVLATTLLTACTTRTTIRTLPRDARVTIDGKTVAKHTPYRVKATKFPFAVGETTVEVSAVGYETETVVLEQVADDKCLMYTATWSIVGGLLIALPILGLFYLPWCTEFDQAQYEIHLDRAGYATYDSHGRRY